MLALTNTPTESGLQSLFGKESLNLKFEIIGIPAMVFVAYCTISPILKNTKATLKATDRNLTGGGKAVLYLFIFTCFLTKVMTIICIFTPPLGLMNTLEMWKELQKPFRNGRNKFTFSAGIFLMTFPPLIETFLGITLNNHIFLEVMV